MKVVRIEIPNFENAEIHIASDWHIGDKSCDMDKIQEQLDYIKNHENAYLICNGDLINNATKTSVSDLYDEQLSPMEELSLIVKFLDPVKDKILMLTQGNHEIRTYKTDGIDLTALVAEQLHLSDRYCREGGLLFIQFGSDKLRSNKKRIIKYAIYSTHGTGGGRKEGSKAIRLADMAYVIDADIYLHSHTHLPMTMKNTFYRTFFPSNSVEKVTRLFVNTSAQLDYGGYGQRYEYKPSSSDCPVIYLDGRKKQFYAKL